MWVDLRYGAEQNKNGFIKKYDPHAKSSRVFCLGVIMETYSTMEFPDTT